MGIFQGPPRDHDVFTPCLRSEEAVPEYPMDDHEGHAGWGHSHIADRLATESSASQDFDL